MSNPTERLTKSLIEMGLRANNVTMSSAVEDKASRKTLEASQADVDPLMAAVEAVLELHQPEEGFGPPGLVCSGCWGEPDPFGPGAEEMPWPCPTVKRLSSALNPRNKAGFEVE